MSAGDLVGSWALGHFEIAAGTQVGKRYRSNFDVVAVDERRPMIVVADGMGDGEGSTRAGQTAVSTFSAMNGPVDAESLRSTMAEAQRRVRAIGDELNQLAGCTLTALVVDNQTGLIVHIGDSRAYRLRDGVLELLTVDHTEAWLGAINGWYPADSPAAARARYHLHRYVGHPAEPEPDVLAVTLRPGDVYCLCTDGLAEQVPYQRLDALLRSDAPVSDVVSTLMDDTMAAGGTDNATVAVLRHARG